MKVPERFEGGGGVDGYGIPYDKDKPYVPPSAKTHNAVLVDYVDMGEVEVDVYGKPGEKTKEHRAKFVYQLAEVAPSGRRHLVAFKPFGVKVSLHEKAAFRQHLESLIGRTFEVGEDVEPEAMVGTPCVLLVVHKKNADGTRTYANIDTVAPHMDGLPKLVAQGYVRVKDRKSAEDATDFNPDEIEA